jgi:hypothetical protein
MKAVVRDRYGPPEVMRLEDDYQGTLIIEHAWPEPGIKYVGSGRPRGPRKTL